MKLVEELKWRGLVFDMTDPSLEKALNEEHLTFYIGVDPTADSLHVGHLLALLVARRLLLGGHHPIIVMGGGTGLIGDPKGTERPLMTIADSLRNAKGIQPQAEHLLPEAIFVNNYDWISSLNAIEFLRDIGKNFNVAYMMSKESFKSRVENGISFTEFAYQIIQAWDFEHLFEKYGCQLQIGGQDQWGNITSGLELIRKLHGSESKAFGFTFPLVTKADGTKFGKTESGAVWLDPLKTTPYQFYQFWINTADDDVVKRLKQFTFFSPEEIDALALDLAQHPEQRNAQKALGRAMTTLIHGNEAYQEALKITEALFTGNIEALTAEEIAIGFTDLLAATVSEDQNIVDLLLKTELASSKREARELLQSGAVSVNGSKVVDFNFMVTKALAIGNQYTILRKGKKKYSLIKHQ